MGLTQTTFYIFKIIIIVVLFTSIDMIHFLKKHIPDINLLL